PPSHQQEMHMRAFIKETAMIAVALGILIGTLAWTAPLGAQQSAEELPPGYAQPRRPNQPRAPVYKDRITPHWVADNTRFWYRNDLRGGAKEFILVDAEKGTRQPAFDHAKLAAALAKAAGTEYKADRLPFDDIEFLSDGKAIRFNVEQTTWQCDLASYE